MFWCVGAAAVYPRSCQHANDHQSLRVKTHFPQPSPKFPTPRNLGQLPPTFPGDFGSILDHFGPKAAQMFQMNSFGTISFNFGPKAVQMLQKVSFGTILYPFGYISRPRPARYTLSK